MAAAGDVVAAYWAATEARDWDRFGALMATKTANTSRACAFPAWARTG